MRTIREFSQEHLIDMVWNKDHGLRQEGEIT